MWPRLHFGNISTDKVGEVSKFRKMKIPFRRFTEKQKEEVR